MNVVLNSIILLLSIVTGVSLHRRRESAEGASARSLPAMLWEALVHRGSDQMIERIAAKNRQKANRMIEFRSKGAPDSIVATPLFGERPHFYTPPSDMEQYRIVKANRGQEHLLQRRKNQPDKIVSRILMGEAPNQQQISGHYYIPYPNDPAHTFPAIKARAMFTRTPKRLREVYVDAADPVQRKYLRPGQRLKVPLKQLEDRFRSVYENGRQQGGLAITMGATPTREMQLWQDQLGYSLDSHRTYDFHNVDGLITPPLPEQRRSTGMNSLEYED